MIIEHALADWSTFKHKDLTTQLFLRLALVIAILNFALVISTSQTLPANPGICYAKAFIPDIYQTFFFAFPIYDGSDEEIEAHYVRDSAFFVCWPSDPKLQNYRLEVSVDDTEEYELFDICTNGLSGLQFDRLLLDTTVSNDFHLTKIRVNAPVVKRSYYEWREVVCQENITLDILNDIRDVLGMKATDSNKMNNKIKRQLNQYQEYYGIAVGPLTLETLEHMGIYLDDY